MSAPMEPLVQLYEDVAAWKRETEQRFDALLSSITVAIVEARDRQRQTWSTTRGTPCVAEITWDEREEPVGHVEPVKSSAMIPPRELNRIERAGE